MKSDNSGRFIELNLAQTKQNKIINEVSRRIEQSRLVKMRVSALIYGFLSLAALASFKPAWVLLSSGAIQTGFVDYFELVLNGGLSLASTWRDLAMSLLESLPIVETTLVIGIIFIFIYSLRHISSTIAELTLYEKHRAHALDSAAIINNTI